MKKKSGNYSKRPSKQFDPGENIPDLVEVPEKTIAVMTELDEQDYLAKLLIEPFAGKKERQWFSQHAYFCLPITFANQHGFGVRTLYDFILRWDGGDSNQNVDVHSFGSTLEHQLQLVSSHFGIGTVTIQNRWTYRTPKGVNLFIGPPPNFPIEGVTPMSAVVETDQLRRDFTFNLRITIPDRDIYIPRGTVVGWFMPYPRNFIDGYKIMLHEKGNTLENERKTFQHFGRARAEFEEGMPNHLYMRGVDIYGNKFAEHQKTLKAELTEISGNGKLLPELLHERDYLPIESSTTHAVHLENMKVPPELLAIYPALTETEFGAILDYVAVRREEGHTEPAILKMLLDGGWSADSSAIILLHSCT